MLGRRSLLVLISTIVSTILSFVSLFFITQYIGAERYGTFLVALAVLTTFNSISDLGFSSAHIKRISEGKNIDDCVSTFLTARLVLTGVMAVVLTISLTVWSTYLGGDISGDDPLLYLLLVVYFVFTNISSAVVTTFTAKTESAKAQMIAVCTSLSLVPMIIFICLFSPSIISLAIVYSVSAFIVATLAIVILIRDRVHFTRPVLFRSYLSFALPLSVVTIVGVAATNIDKILIGWYNVSDVSYYSTSQTLIAVFSVIGASVSTLTFPAFSKMHSEGNMDEIRSTTRAAERYICMIGLPIVLLLVLFPTEVVVALFKSTWSSAGGPLRFLALAMMFDLMNTVYNSQILAVNRPDISAKLNIIYITILIAALIIFVPPEIAGIPLMGLSATGAGIALMIATGTNFVLVRLVVRRLTGTVFNKRILVQFISVEMTGIVLLLVNEIYPLNGLIPLVLYGLLTLAVFIGCLIVFRELKKEDISYFTDLINPKKMRSYITSELKNDESKKE